MVILLNYLPLITVLVGMYFVWRFIEAKKTRKALIALGATVLISMGIAAVTPSYMPKGTVREASVPHFDTVETPVENRLRQARTEEEHSERLNEGLDWKEKAAQSKAEAEETE